MQNKENFKTMENKQFLKEKIVKAKRLLLIYRIILVLLLAVDIGLLFIEHFFDKNLHFWFAISVVVAIGIIFVLIMNKSRDVDYLIIDLQYE